MVRRQGEREPSPAALRGHSTFHRRAVSPLHEEDGIPDQHSERGIVDQDALVVALREGWIAGAVLDVFTPERLSPDHPLLALQNVIATPHVAQYSEESLLDLGRLAPENMAAVLAGNRPASVVNPEVLGRERWLEASTIRNGGAPVIQAPDPILATNSARQACDPLRPWRT